jgi:hypothetical protein
MLAQESAAKTREEPEEERDGCAEHKAGDDREIEGRVFAPMNDVAGQPAETEWKPAAEVEKDTDKDAEGAENEEGAAEFAKRVHPRILRLKAIPAETLLLANLS